MTDLGHSSVTTDSVSLHDKQYQFWALYLIRFTGQFGFAALVILLPYYVNRLHASGLVTGLFYSGFTAAQLLAVVPLAWMGDRYDKRIVLGVSLILGIVIYGLFTFVTSSGDACRYASTPRSRRGLD